MNIRLTNCSLSLAAALLLGPPSAHAQETQNSKLRTQNSPDTNAPGWLTAPMTLADAVKLALYQNGDMLKAGHELEATDGLAVQTRSITLPTIRGSAGYLHTEAVEDSPFGGPSQPRDQWLGGIRIRQTIYEGGRLRSARRAASLTREQALLRYQTTVAETILAVRIAYYDALLAEQQITVQEASVKLLAEQLDITKKRFDAGAVPRFELLRAEVAVANARPRLIRARNAHRIAKNNLAVLLGYNVPATVWEDIPMTLTSRLGDGSREMGDGIPTPNSQLPTPLLDLPAALAQAIARRPELGVLRKEEALRKEAVVAAQSKGRPALGLFAGYAANNSEFRDDFTSAVSGPIAGVELHWDLWDGHLTKGRVSEARALHRRAGADLDDQTRKVELEVRSAWSAFLEAREVLESQLKVQEQAEEALRLAGSRYEAGTGTQLDVLDAQTALTEARSTQVQALRDFATARARLERATGQDVTFEVTPVRDKP